MAEVVLIRPKFCPPSEVARESRPPTGLLYLAAMLVPDGVTVKIMDQSVEDDWRSFLEENIGAETICVGITSLTGNMIQNGIEMVKHIRTLTSAPVVWGGVHPSLEPDTTIQSTHVDMIVVDEGEETFPELVRYIRDKGDLSHVRGIIYKKDGKIFKNAPRERYDLNNLPPLPLDLANLEKYRGHQMLSYFFRFNNDIAISFETSRGCTNKCTYCVMASDNYDQKSKWRGMTAKKIADNVEFYINRYNVRSFVFVDDNFFANPLRARDFIEEVEKRKLAIEWFADLRMDTAERKLGVEFMKRAERAGLRSLGIGIESGSNRILAFLNKGEKRDTYIEANRILAQTGITPQYGFIQGLPGEKVEDIKETYTLIARFLLDNPNAIPSVNKLLPTPNTPLLKECMKAGWKPPTTFEGWVNYCDTHWVHGPTPWMDKEAAKFIISQLYYDDIITIARSPRRRVYLLELILKISTKLLMFRVSSGFSYLRIEAFFYRIIRIDFIYTFMKKVYLGFLRLQGQARR